MRWTPISPHFHAPWTTHARTAAGGSQQLKQATLPLEGDFGKTKPRQLALDAGALEPLSKGGGVGRHSPGRFAWLRGGAELKVPVLFALQVG